MLQSGRKAFKNVDWGCESRENYRLIHCWVPGIHSGLVPKSYPVHKCLLEEKQEAGKEREGREEIEGARRGRGRRKEGRGRKMAGKKADGPNSVS